MKTLIVAVYRLSDYDYATGSGDTIESAFEDLCGTARCCDLTDRDDIELKDCEFYDGLEFKVKEKVTTRVTKTKVVTLVRA